MILVILLTLVILVIPVIQTILVILVIPVILVRRWGESSQEMVQEATQSSEESTPMETVIGFRFPWSGAKNPTQALVG